MCGIVGLLVKHQKHRSRLGEWMLPMLVAMTERGPDSAGLAVFTEPAAKGRRKVSLYAADRATDWIRLGRAAKAEFGRDSTLTVKTNHAILECKAKSEALRAWVNKKYPELYILSAGQAMDLYKSTGLPAEIAERYDFRHLKGTHLVGHTRMATESAVTPAHAHPFTAGEDFCLVHNGSLSNPFSIRRKLEPLGIHFDTDNDTEAATRFLEWRMRDGDDLKTAVQKGFDQLDGFYTFLMGTKNQLALVRDAFSCKPAVVAETDDYVAISSEFRALAKLPGVKNARIFEPMPEEIYLWSA